MTGQSMPGKNPDDTFGLVPPRIEEVPENLDEFDTEMGRTSTSFTTLAGNPGFKAALLQEGRLHRYFDRALRNIVFLRKAADQVNPRQN